MTSVVTSPSRNGSHALPPEAPMQQQIVGILSPRSVAAAAAGTGGGSVSSAGASSVGYDIEDPSPVAEERRSPERVRSRRSSAEAHHHHSRFSTSASQPGGGLGGLGSEGSMISIAQQLPRPQRSHSHESQGVTGRRGSRGPYPSPSDRSSGGDTSPGSLHSRSQSRQRGRGTRDRDGRSAQHDATQHMPGAGGGGGGPDDASETSEPPGAGGQGGVDRGVAFRRDRTRGDRGSSGTNGSVTSYVREGAGGGQGRRRLRHTNSGAKPARMAVQDALKLLSISDTATGVALYQQHWSRWIEPKDQASLGKLIGAFYQFASMVLCMHDDTITVAVFYDVPKSTTTSSRSQDMMREFLEAARAEFSKLYRVQVEAMAPRLQQFANGSGDAAALQVLQEGYTGFAATVEQLKRSCFPQPEDTISAAPTAPPT
ncbi:hypothetical protein JKP88DRAFT_266354 [Tribonema minus]|uniref:Uncharacterized protein n=1 Tax=Tribonema minus TaxID=303371 RepID=A0A835ZIX2_9STRA|nr:hypothetical protein JKP88DRAFT_266354 [Tribonema minus]